MRKFSIIIILFLLITNLFASKWIPIKSQQQSPAKINLVSSNINSSIINFSFDGFEMTDVSIKGKLSNKLKLDEATPLLIKNAPDLLKLTASVIIPNKSLMTVEVISSNYKDFKNINIAPSKGNLTRDIDPANIPYAYGKVYNENKFYPGKLSELRDPFIMRDYRGQTIIIYPFQYNPVSKTLRVYYDLTIEISEKNQNGKNQLSKNKTSNSVSSEFNKLYKHQFLNYGNSKYTPLAEQGNMLIITHGNYMSTMQPLVEWKNTIGIPTEIVNVATIGTTASAIKTYVSNYYNTNGLTFLMLVGDANQIPTNVLSSGHSDNAYGFLTGNDSYPELFVGRFSAENTAHAQTQVEKTINYEFNPTLSTGGFNKGIGIASQQGPGDDNEYDYEHIRNMSTDLLSYNYNYCYELFDGNQGGLDASGNPTSSMVGSAVNNGASVILYTGHGSTSSWGTSSFNKTDVNSLTNTEILPFIWAVACVNGNFVGNTCFAEAWLRATNNGSPTGAIATLMSTINQSWDPPMDAQDEMVDILIESSANNIKRTFGGLSMNGCMKMNDDYGSQGAKMTETWNIFGDPSLMIRTDTPTTMLCSHIPNIFLGSNNCQVNCNENGAFVALTINNQIIGTATVSGGTATITFPALTNIDTIVVAVTAYNKIPYIAEVPILIASGPYVLYKNNQINDTAGNNNGYADYNENINLNVGLENIGISTANGVIATLSTKDIYVTITDSTQNWGNIPDSSYSTQNNAFEISIANNVPDNHSVLFKIDIKDSDSNSWSSNFSLNTYAPKLLAGDFSIYDANGGNGNNKLEPGETATIIIQSKNTGHSDCYNASATLKTTSMSVAVIDWNYTIGTIQNGNSENSVFKIKLDSTIPLGTSIGLVFDLSSGGYQIHNTYYAQIGTMNEDFETGDFTKFNWYTPPYHHWTISNQAYDGQYCMKSGNVVDNQNSVMSLVLEVLADDTISFYKKVSCENAPSNTWYDFLEFSIDNISLGKWDGNVNWSKSEFPVTAGTRTFKWVYSKDGMISQYDDCAWIDNIVFPPIATPAKINDLNNSEFFLNIYPNPFTDKLNIEYYLEKNSNVKISIYNAIGQRVKILTDSKQSAGKYSVKFNGAELKSGIYFCKIEIDSFSEMKKIVRIKN